MTEISPEEGGAANGCKDRTDAPLMAYFFFFSPATRLTICESKLALTTGPAPFTSPYTWMCLTHKRFYCVVFEGNKAQKQRKTTQQLCSSWFGLGWKLRVLVGVNFFFKVCKCCHRGATCRVSILGKNHHMSSFGGRVAGYSRRVSTKDVASCQFCELIYNDQTSGSGARM